MANNARLTDPKMLIEAGINPKTGLPSRIDGTDTGCLKPEIKKQLRILDEQDAVNRFTWYNLPKGLNSRLIERILYYKGQGMMFFLDDKFYFLPYALNGTIDVYGRYTKVTPLPFNGTANDGKADKPWIQGLDFTPIYDAIVPEEYIAHSEEEILDKLSSYCVLLKDYTEQYSERIISRQILNDPLLDMMSECFPLLRTSLFNSTGVQGMRVNTEGESASVFAANNALARAALNGHSKVPIVGNVDFQDLAGGAIAKAEEFLLTMQSLDNYRLSLYGLDNGGLFQKKSHVLESEQQMNAGNIGLILRDSLKIRQDFCDIVNSIWNLGIWCEASETVLNADINGDGIASDSNPKVTETTEEETVDVE